MSSILRALKKIEDETNTSSGISTGPAMTSVARIREKSLIVKWTFIVVIMVSVALGGLFLSKKTDRPETASLSIPEKEAVSDIASKQELIPKETSKTPLQRIPAAKSEGQNFSEIHTPVQVPVRKFPDQETIKEEQKDSISKPIETGTIDVDKDIPEPGKAGAIIESGKINLPEQKPVVRQNQAEIAELDPSAGLDLQAISWASDAKKRLVVINGGLRREGESVNGYIIKQINPDDVIVSNGATTGKLVLKIR